MKPTLPRDPLLQIAGLGLVSATVGLLAAPQRFWANALLAGFFALSVSLGALVFLAVQTVSGSVWSRGFESVPKRLASGLWVGLGLVALAVGLGSHSLYAWLHGEASHAAHAQALWLSRPLQLLRLALYAGLWLGLGRALLRRSNPSAGLAGGFLAVFALTFSSAGMEWIMALEPAWYSTIFAVYLFAGAFLAALGSIAVALALLKRAGTLPRGVGEETFHDLGKLIFAFSCFWAYIAYCQYLLIWYTNMPEETGFFLLRTRGPWGFLMALSVALNWAVPFFALMTRDSKRNPNVLLRVGVCILFGRWLDLYLLIMPRFLPGGPDMAGWELGLFAGAAALLAWACLKWRGAREAAPC